VLNTLCAKSGTLWWAAALQPYTQKGLAVTIQVMTWRADADGAYVSFIAPPWEPATKR
jgi:hypothetical protein